MEIFKILIFFAIVFIFVFLLKDLILHSKKFKTAISISLFYAVVAILSIARSPYMEETFVFYFLTILYIIAFLITSFFNKKAKENYILFATTIITTGTISSIIIAYNYHENLLKIPMLYFQFIIALSGGFLFYLISKLSTKFLQKN